MAMRYFADILTKAVTGKIFWRLYRKLASMSASAIHIGYFALIKRSIRK
jgi:hypothetical protein